MTDSNTGRLYVDGCSFVYGVHLSRNFSLANLINATKDFSQCGKSNIAICEDIYQNIDKFDSFVVGFSFSPRYTFERNNKRQHLLPNRKISDFGSYDGAEADEKMFAKFNDWFYYFSNIDTLSLRSDFYVDSIINLFEKYNKKFVVFSFEKRNTMSNQVLYPKFDKSLFLPDGHLNENGMKELSNLVLKKLNEQ